MRDVKSENGHQGVKILDNSNGHSNGSDNIRKRSFSEHNRTYSADGLVYHCNLPG